MLMILDGWGIGNNTKSDVISSTSTPYWDRLLSEYPHSQLEASGENVGLPDGQMGNSEVGHLNIGAGRVLYQDLVKINRACRDNSILSNRGIVEAFEYAKSSGKNVHFMGLVSDGGVHSSLEHLFKLFDAAKHFGVSNAYVHCFMDGRDTDPRSGLGYIESLQKHLSEVGGNIATVLGRYYAMDRDKRWDRIKVAYDLLVLGEGEKSTNLLETIQTSYNNDVTDEFIKPIVHVDAEGNPIAKISADDVVIFFNYRNDRAKEITTVLTQQDMPEEGMSMLPLKYFTMTPYDPTYKNVTVLFDKENVKETLGEVVSKAGMKQLHIAETEKYAHVTFFFNGGQELPYEGEERILIGSPKVSTYDLQPEMSAYEVADALCEELDKQKFEFVVVNFANGDMVGHTGIYDAIEKAVVTVDNCLEQVVERATANDYEVIIIADHGNADNAINADGTVNTAHSLNPVPFVYVSKNDNVQLKNGILADVAPSILKLLGVEKPQEMTGQEIITF